MTEETKKPELSKEEVLAQIGAYRDAIIKSAVDNNLNFDVVFNALAQVASSFLFDFLLLTDGELTEKKVKKAVNRFKKQLEATATAGFENLKEQAAAQAAAEDEVQVTEDSV